MLIPWEAEGSQEGWWKMSKTKKQYFGVTINSDEWLERSLKTVDIPFCYEA